METKKNVVLYWKLRGNQAEMAFHLDRASAFGHRDRILGGAKICRASFDVEPFIAEKIDHFKSCEAILASKDVPVSIDGEQKTHE